MLRKMNFRSAFLKLLQELKIEDPSRLKESGIGNFINSWHDGLKGYTYEAIWKKLILKKWIQEKLSWFKPLKAKEKTFWFNEGNISETVALHSFEKFIPIFKYLQQYQYIGR